MYGCKLYLYVPERKDGPERAGFSGWDECITNEKSSGRKGMKTMEKAARNAAMFSG